MDSTKPQIPAIVLVQCLSLQGVGCASQSFRRIFFFTGFVGHLARAILGALCRTARGEVYPLRADKVGFSLDVGAVREAAGAWSNR